MSFTEEGYLWVVVKSVYIHYYYGDRTRELLDACPPHPHGDIKHHNHVGYTIHQATVVSSGLTVTCTLAGASF